MPACRKNSCISSCWCLAGRRCLNSEHTPKEQFATQCTYGRVLPTSELQTCAGGEQVVIGVAMHVGILRYCDLGAGGGVGVLGVNLANRLSWCVRVSATWTCLRFLNSCMFEKAPTHKSTEHMSVLCRGKSLLILVWMLSSPATSDRTDAFIGYSEDKSTTAQSSCQDKESGCSIWQKNGECLANPYYMRVNCAQSCQIPSCAGYKQQAASWKGHATEYHTKQYTTRLVP